MPDFSSGPASARAPPASARAPPSPARALRALGGGIRALGRSVKGEVSRGEGRARRGGYFFGSLGLASATALRARVSAARRATPPVEVDELGDRAAHDLVVLGERLGDPVGPREDDGRPRGAIDRAPTRKLRCRRWNAGASADLEVGRGRRIREPSGLDQRMSAPSSSSSSSRCASSRQAASLADSTCT